MWLYVLYEGGHGNLCRFVTITEIRPYVTEKIVFCLPDTLSEYSSNAGNRFFVSLSINYILGGGVTHLRHDLGTPAGCVELVLDSR